MNSMKAEIKECLCVNLDSELDTWLSQFGFARRENTLLYSRTLPEAIQYIEIALEIHPKDRPDAAAIVFPFLEVRMDHVNRLLTKMTDGDTALIGAPNITLRQPIAFTSGDSGLGARWPIFQPDSVSEVVREMKSFLQRWTLPFLDTYSAPRGICDAYERDDARVINDLSQKLRVVAAMVLCGRSDDAVGVMEKWFGKPGPRKRYQRVFDYLSAKN
jgi:hypothetical protein